MRYNLVAAAFASRGFTAEWPRSTQSLLLPDKGQIAVPLRGFQFLPVATHSDGRCIEPEKK
jgi:hypothetical protein